MTEKSWNIGEPGGPAGPFYSVVKPDGQIVAMQILTQEMAELIASIPQLQAEVERLRAAHQRLESYLNQIAGSAQEWDCNKLGGVNIQRKRWQRLGELARTALRR